VKTLSLLALSVCAGLGPLLAAEPPPVPRFSVANMDRSVSPVADFYRFACGNWLKNNPVPADKSRWSGFDELQQRNWFLIQDVLEHAADAKANRDNLTRQVGDFFASAMNTNQLEQFGFTPIQSALKRIDSLKSVEELFALLADLHLNGSGALFNTSVGPDAKNSEIYALRISQGGLGLPDRDYYLTDGFAKEREAYRAHITRILALLGEPEKDADTHAATVLALETELARASKTRVEMRDPNANYHKKTLTELDELAPNFSWKTYFQSSGIRRLDYAVVGQPEFLQAEGALLKSHPLADWKVYLRWHVLREAASYLHAAAEQENFAFYGTTLSGQPQPEPRWQRAAKAIDRSIGEALGKLYVEKYYPATARARMNELVENVKEVFRDRLKKVDWMTEETRAKALVKFERFTQKIGHPEKFRDYSSVKIRRNDYFGNVQRAAAFESKRQLARIGKPVDRTEWRMTPQTVNAYFSPLQNEIVFPAGILQPPFFDVEMDDAVNYGAIGVVIGHEITHGYDDKGRQYDADGNLKDWWTEKDAKEFEARAQKLVDQYGGYEPLPGQKVNGRLTLGENIADLGGTSIAFEALQRTLSKDPAKRKKIDGFTPEQRFFLSLAQLWRVNWREAELRRRLTVDPHAPAQYRGLGPHVNLQPFFDAFDIKPGDPMWRLPEQRANIW